MRSFWLLLQVLGQREPGDLFPEGVFTLEDIKDYGRQHSICPYFALRRMMPFVDVIIYSFHYLLDPKVADQVSKELSGEAIVVFDEAHNIGLSTCPTDASRAPRDRLRNPLKPV
jgi:Rad3-related DNA helicase